MYLAASERLQPRGDGANHPYACRRSERYVSMGRATQVMLRLIAQDQLDLEYLLEPNPAYSCPLGRRLTSLVIQYSLSRVVMRCAGFQLLQDGLSPVRLFLDAPAATRHCVFVLCTHPLVSQ